MSSTSDADKERIAREFYEANLLPLARRAGDGAPYFPLGADPSLPTYFIRRAKTRWTAQDFECQSVATPQELGAALAAFWQQAGQAELAALAPGFAALAASVYDVDTRAGEVTPFMYVMF